MDEQVLKLLTDRMDSQDRVLAQILTEARKTNGRVTSHDHRLGLLEQHRADQTRARLERHRHRWTKLELFGALAAAVLCGSAHDILRALGWA